MENLTVCLYGASSNNIDVKYINEVEEFGKAIARRGYRMVYGGGSQGLMGAAARGVRSEDGEVLSVVPRFMKNYEDIFDDYTHICWTETMAQRKSIMEDNADAFVIVPGGIGTFDEFFQILALKTLDRYIKPIIIFNIDGFYDPLLNAIADATFKGFIRKDIMNFMTVADNIKDIMKVLDNIKK